MASIFVGIENKEKKEEGGDGSAVVSETKKNGILFTFKGKNVIYRNR